MPLSVDAFTLPHYDIPDAMPAEIANDNKTTMSEYKIPLVLWMFLFLFAGYVGLRLVMED